MMTATVLPFLNELIPEGICDIHFHVGPDAPWRAGRDHSVTVKQAREVAAKHGIAQLVAFANPRPRADYAPVDSDFPQNDPLFLPFLRFDPRDPDHASQRLTDSRTARFRGVKLHPTVEFFGADHPALLPVFKQIAASGRILLIHTDGRDGSLAHASRLDEIGRLCPELTVIMAHCNWGCLPLLTRYPQFFVDTSCSRDGSLEVALHSFPDRVLFGSDYPYSDPAIEIRRVLDFRPADSVKKLVFRENFQCLLPPSGDH